VSKSFEFSIWSAPASWRAPLAETSSGERQRLLLAQTPIGRPRLLLLDEPLISLDPHYQRDVVELAKSYSKRWHYRAVQRPRAESTARRA
jgi:ABC-type multidrug transport system ATPase subunit